MAISLASAVRVLGRNRRISLHSFDVAAPDRVVVNPIVRSDAQYPLDLAELFGVALGFGLSAPACLAILDLVHGSARELQPASAHWEWLVPPGALPGLILPSWTVNWTDFSSRLTPHAASELACGLVPIPILIAGLITHGRELVKKIKWELVLLLLVLLLSMIPTAGLFRWSFRWLPFFHLVLAICAAEALRVRSGSAIPATAALALVVLTAIAISILRADG